MMFKLEEKIEKEIIGALKGRDQIKLNAYRLIKATIKNERIFLGEKFTETDLTKVLRRELKKRQEAAEAFKQAQREESAQQEAFEAEIIKALLPQELSDVKIKQVVADAISQEAITGSQDFGKVMKLAMAKLAGQADGNKVSLIVKELLSTKNQ